MYCCWKCQCTKKTCVQFFRKNRKRGFLKFEETILWLEDRLKHPLPGREAHERMLGRVRSLPLEVPADARPSAVLSLLFPVENETHLLLIRRTEDGRPHSGQISFPGGKQDPTDASLRATALREAQEEVGIISSEVQIMGALTPLYIPVSNFMVYPFVAFAAYKPEYNLSRSEVAEVIEAPLQLFLSADTKTRTRVTSPADKNFAAEVNAYQLKNGAIVWGATAMILSELEEVVRQGFSDASPF